MARTAASFVRSGSTIKAQPSVLIICEDEKSGKSYVEDAAYYYRINVKVRVVHCGRTDPKGIVTEALRQLRNYDNIFCVVDRDSHPCWEESINLAKGHDGLEVIASYPCFEFWLLLHFGVSRKPYSRSGNKSPGDCCVADLKKMAGLTDYDKGADRSIFDLMLNSLPKARENSLKVYNQAVADGEMNPSSRLHALFDFFEELEKQMDEK